MFKPSFSNRTDSKLAQMLRLGVLGRALQQECEGLPSGVFARPLSHVQRKRWGLLPQSGRADVLIFTAIIVPGGQRDYCLIALDTLTQYFPISVLAELRPSYIARVSFNGT